MSDTQPDRDFIRVGPSSIEGKGAFAKRPIPRGTRIIEYTGARRTIESLVTDLANGAEPSVYLINLHEGVMIDGSIGGNDARFINHGCDPNCEIYLFGDRLYVYAMRDIEPNEELTFDYALNTPPGVAVKKGRAKDFACHCGSAGCRGTMLQNRRKSPVKSTIS
jgi:SET domain-containing protein